MTPMSDLRILRRCLALGVALAASGAAWAGHPPIAAATPDPAATGPSLVTPRNEPAHVDLSHYMFEDQIKPGMKGYGLTVMHANKIERFDIEVIDVMKNFMPGNNAILIKCSGLGLEHSGIIAGMSGSPVYINDKMIGAVAFGWETSKDPIGGVQPIRQMLNIALPGQEDGKNGAKVASTGGMGRGLRDANVGISNRWRQTGTWMDAGWQRPGWNRLLKKLNPQGPSQALARGSDDGRAGLNAMRPLAAPVMASGISATGLAMLNKSFESSGLIPMKTGAAGSLDGKPLGGAAMLKPGDIKLEPGSAISIPILTGDMDLSAIGTVTEVTDGHVWAFGHAMFAEGATELPMSTGYIYTILPSLTQSFKMGASFRPAGSLVRDEQTGIVGRFGKSPKLIPIEIAVKTTDGSVERTYHYEMANHPKLSPEILRMCLTETLTAQRGLPRQFTARVTGEVKFNGVTLQVDSMGTSHSMDMFDILMAAAMLMDNPFEDLKLQSVKLQARVEPVDHSAEIKSVELLHDVVAPGDQVTISVQLTPFQDKTADMNLSFRIPESTPDGNYQLLIGSASMALDQEQSTYPQRFDPEGIAALSEAVQRVLSYRNNQIYARLTLNVDGAAEGGRELHNLPGTRTAMYLSSKRSSAVPVQEVRGFEQPMDYVVSDGGQTVSITVDKDAHKRYYSSKRGDSGCRGSMIHPGSLGDSLPKTGPGPVPGPIGP